MGKSSREWARITTICICILALILFIYMTFIDRGIYSSLIHHVSIVLAIIALITLASSLRTDRSEHTVEWSTLDWMIIYFIDPYLALYCYLSDRPRTGDDDYYVHPDDNRRTRWR